jgi:4-hydroxy-tetrahydrodipicolinate reductase
MAKSTPPYRVVQWATGNIGARSLRAVIEHPHMTLVGLYVTNPSKIGRDAGELCGLAPTGVKATGSIDDIIALKPDCVLYMQQGTNFDDLSRLLASGANVVTTRPDFLNPAVLDPARRKQIEEACGRGGTSIHSTGSSPGFSTEALPLVLCSLQRRLDCLTIDEFADTSSRNSPEMIFDIMGFGKPGREFDERRLGHIKESFPGSLALLAEAMSIPIDRFETTGENALARKKLSIAAGVIESGTVAAMRITVAGYRNGRPVLRFRANWYVGTDIDTDWQLRDSGWRILVEGDTPLDVSIGFPVPIEQYAAFTPGLTAHRPVNAIPFVCAASPGIRTTADLPQIIPMLG